MKFEEKTAKEVIEKYNLSEKTLRVWKTRGKIPKKYFDSDFDNSGKIGKVKFERLSKVLLSPKINLAELARNADIKLPKLYEVNQGKNRNITEAEYIRIKRRLNEIRIEMKKINKDRVSDLALKDVMKMLNTPELVINVIFGGKWIEFRLGRSVAITQEDYTELRDNIMIFLLEISL